MSYFMLNDHPDFFQQGVNTLEKLTHQYHMHEIYAAAAPIYNAMKENPPSDPELCACVNDITGNGILIEMANIARQLKYFESKRRPRAKAPPRINLGYGGGCLGWSINIYVCRKKRAAENTESDEAKIADLEQEYLTNPTHETAFSLLDARPWKTNTLVSISSNHFSILTILTSHSRWALSNGSPTRRC